MWSRSERIRGACVMRYTNWRILYFILYFDSSSMIGRAKNSSNFESAKNVQSSNVAEFECELRHNPRDHAVTNLHHSCYYYQINYIKLYKSVCEQLPTDIQLLKTNENKRLIHHVLSSSTVKYIADLLTVACKWFVSSLPNTFCRMIWLASRLTTEHASVTVQA